MNLSIKLSALDCHFDAIDPEGSLARAGQRLRELLRVARQHRAFVNVDMESYEKKDLTLWIFQQVLSEQEFRDVTDVGIVIQCYLRDAAADLQRLVEWTRQRDRPVWVRLVKGAYWDYETIHAKADGWPIPVYQRKWQSDANFERATRYVLAHRDFLRPALGTHNLRSIAHGIAVAEHLGLPKNAFELQMLYGMADGEKQALVGLGHRLRIYMPYGELIPGMAYLVRRLLENTSNDSFLRAGFVDNVSRDKLLRSPAEVGRDTLPPDSSPVSSEPAMPATAPLPAFASTFRNHPPVDFADPGSRAAMRSALQEVMTQWIPSILPSRIGWSAAVLQLSVRMWIRQLQRPRRPDRLGKRSAQRAARL
jgi:RHH-type proline utilization regulon transcriptional repressor/proline dehydrogenase/delta 1-pyrroline-5-carboxylate dehydrogenase